MLAVPTIKMPNLDNRSETNQVEYLIYDAISSPSVFLPFKHIHLFLSVQTNQNEANPVETPKKQKQTWISKCKFIKSVYQYDRRYAFTCIILFSDSSVSGT